MLALMACRWDTMKWALMMFAAHTPEPLRGTHSSLRWHCILFDIVGWSISCGPLVDNSWCFLLIFIFEQTSWVVHWWIAFEVCYWEYLHGVHYNSIPYNNIDIYSWWTDDTVWFASAIQKQDCNLASSWCGLFTWATVHLLCTLWGTLETNNVTLTSG